MGGNGVAFFFSWLVIVIFGFWVYVVERHNLRPSPSCSQTRLQVLPG